jgi:methionyl aminopeptidase
LIVPHYDDPKLDVMMHSGMVFTIEPMLTLGTIEYDLSADGWTVTTADNKRSAQFEHTVAVTDTCVDVLSALP